MLHRSRNQMLNELINQPRKAPTADISHSMFVSFAATTKKKLIDQFVN